MLHMIGQIATAIGITMSIVAIATAGLIFSCLNGSMFIPSQSITSSPWTMTILTYVNIKSMCLRMMLRKKATI